MKEKKEKNKHNLVTTLESYLRVLRDSLQCIKLAGFDS